MTDPSKPGRRPCMPRPLADHDLLRKSVGTCGLGLWEWHIAEGSLVIDQTVCELLGLPAGTAALPAGRFLDLVHEADVADLKQAIQASLGSASNGAHEFRVHCHGTGKLRWLALKWCVTERDDDDEPLAVAGLTFDVTKARLEQETKDLVNREIAHRLKNILSIVGSVVSLSGEHRPEAREFITAFQSRLGSLAATHELFTLADWRPIVFGRLLEKVLAPLGVLERIDVSGNLDFLLGSHDAQTLALVLHELATNAIKHGALSNGDGRIALGVEARDSAEGDEQALLVLRWEETGGPAVTTPTTNGFGLTLLERLTRRSVQIEPVMQWGPHGFVCCFSISVMPSGQGR